MAATSGAAVDVRRAAERARTRLSWLDSRHSFSFGGHYDPSNTHFGLLLVSNDDVVRPGAGFETHPHRDMEIVTWVLRGQLVHQDSEGNSGVIYPGLAQRMTAGRGILHSEKNDSWRLSGEAPHDDPVRFVQMWVVPDEAGAAPGYEQREIDDRVLRGGLVPVASGRPGVTDAAIRIRQRDATLHAARMVPGESLRLPAAPFVHVFVADGSVELEGAGPLSAGDAVRLTGADGPRVTAGAAAEILVWEMHADLGG
jgi:redox-sensitive bicupin YhaK (pirin superfamily)